MDADGCTYIGVYFLISIKLPLLRADNNRFIHPSIRTYPTTRECHHSLTISSLITLPMMNRLRNRFQVWTRDGISLSKELWNNSRNYEEGRATLLSFANDKNNIWAISFFKIEKEINLLQYYGPIQYMKLQQQSSSPSNTTTTTTTTTNNKEDMNTAKVAFMITSTQRKELQTMLGYTQNEIKSLNPTEAQIILQHQLPPTTEGQIKLKQLLTTLQSSSDNNNNNNNNNNKIGRAHV